MITGLGWVDLAMLGVLGLSVLVGLVRGLVFEVLALLGWVVAYVVALAMAPAVLPYLPVLGPGLGTGPQQAAAFALVFIATLIVWTLLARLVRVLVHATPLSLLDRLAGAGFGLLRGALLLLVAATVVAYTPAAQSPHWQASVGAGWLGQASQALVPWLPSSVAQWLPSRTRN